MAEETVKCYVCGIEEVGVGAKVVMDGEVELLEGWAVIVVCPACRELNGVGLGH